MNPYILSCEMPADLSKEHFEKRFKGVRLICRDTEENRYELARRFQK